MTLIVARPKSTCAPCRRRHGDWLKAGVSGCVIAAAGVPAFAQATIDNGAATASDMATRLDGFGITITSADIPSANNSDATNMYGLFSNGIAGGGFEIDSGVAFSTGSITEMFTSNSARNSSIGGTTTYTDTQLTAIEAGATRNVSLVTMNVTLDPYIEGLEVRYQFGSDEYPDYVGSTFNDLIAILISGPGITGVDNIADDPLGGSTDINTINYGVRGCATNGAAVTLGNSSSYIRNGHSTTLNGANLACNPAAQPGPFPVVAEWNGLTRALTAERLGLTAGQTYTMKIAIADVGDAQYDSGAIFEVIRGLYGRDYGDAPNGAGYGNPYHEVRDALRLGASVTTERTSNANATATGDADNGLIMPVLTALSATTIQVSATGGAGYLQAWFDWNDDGDFADAGEQAASNLQDGDGDGYIAVTVTPPVTASAYDTFARFRWSSNAGLTATQNTTFGEVEDYPVSVNTAAGGFSCPAGMIAVTQSGNAVAIVSTPPGASNPNNALGAILAAGTATNTGNSARLTSTLTMLGLDLGSIIPQNAPITLSVARDDNAGAMAIDTSTDGTNWTQRLTFNAAPNDLAQRVTLTSPAGGARYLRFRRTAGNLWVDGAAYSAVCQGTAQMQGSKSIVVYDPGAAGIYALPGNDVIYTINVANVGGVNADSNSVLVIDKVPAEVEILNGPTPEFGGQVAGFTQTGTSLTFNSAADLAWSDDGTRPASFAACDYTPAAGYDALITYVCFNPKGIFPAGDPDPAFSISLRARIK